MALDMNGIKNENEFFTTHYIAAMLEGDLEPLVRSWKEEAETTAQRTPARRLQEWGRRRLKRDRSGAAAEENLLPELLEILGYEPARAMLPLGDGSLRAEAEVRRASGAPELWVLAVKDEEDGQCDPLECPLYLADEQGQPLPDDAAPPAEEALNSRIFAAAEPPRFVLLFSSRQCVLADRFKWNARRLLRFYFDDIFNRRDEKILYVMAALLHRQHLCPQDGPSLLDALDEKSHRHAYGVSEDLKYALRECIELLGNEAVRWLRQEAREKVYDGALDPAELSLECLRYMYRLLFLFYIEARPDLGYVPLSSETYLSGYSLESLRELEMMNLTDEESRNGTYLQQSLDILFGMIWDGYKGSSGRDIMDATPRIHEFDIAPLRSHLFDPDKTPLLRRVRFRNEVLQQVIRLMSLTRPKNRERRGRISYAQLGINQLGAVYEALLSYRGFFAQTDLYEVKADPQDDELQTAYFIPAEDIEKYRRNGEDKLVYENGPDGHRRLKVYQKGCFIYRMAGRDREKSASYYTPESLTRCLVRHALKALREGKIVAVKGLGGFHLACDAANPKAVALLRQRKTRRDKPFALMAANVASAKRWAKVTSAEEKELLLPSHPIVLMKKTPEVDRVMPLAAPGLSEIGIMLAYTPVHLLLFHEAMGRPAGTKWLEHQEVPLVLVMTSANPRGEPLVTQNDEALEKLGGIADVFLMNNRDIVCRCDDSVVRVIDETPRIVRRARGFTPLAVKTKRDMTGIIGLGASLKVTAAIGRGQEVFVTEHVGDTDNPAVCAALEDSIEHFLDILEVKPQAFACDLHPDFFTTRLAQKLSSRYDAPLFAVQHHHAHAAAVACEYGIEGPYAALTLDGVGLGLNQEIWGCELLTCDAPGAEGSFVRVGHLEDMALPGGDKAAREPWRMGASLLALCQKDDLIEKFWPQHAHLPMAALIHNERLTRRTSSAGRLFDGVSALAGLCEAQQDEAYAAMLLETAAEGSLERPYPVLADGWQISDKGVLSLRPLLGLIIEMLQNDRSRKTASRASALFHGTLAAALAAWVNARTDASLPVVLAGGTFLNRFLASEVAARLKAFGRLAYLPRELPAGDGAVSFGQTAVAAKLLKN